MVLSTVSPAGRPEARTLILKSLAAEVVGGSRRRVVCEGAALAATPHAALTFYWPQLGRQGAHNRPGDRAAGGRARRRLSRARPRVPRRGADGPARATPLDDPAAATAAHVPTRSRASTPTRSLAHPPGASGSSSRAALSSSKAHQPATTSASATTSPGPTRLGARAAATRSAREAAPASPGNAALRGRASERGAGPQRSTAAGARPDGY